MSTLRIAVVSDVHGNLPALEAVVIDLARRGADLALNLGDCATSPLWPADTVDLLDTLAWPTVRGNHDRWLDPAELPDAPPTVAYTRGALGAVRCAALAALPSTLELDGVLAVHGTPGSDTTYLLEDAIDGRLALATPDMLALRLGDTPAGLVLCGHSHHQHVAMSRGRMVLNPGSVGSPRAADNAQPAAVEAGTPHARYAVATRRHGVWSAELMTVAYAFEDVAARARQAGRADWATLFECGTPER
jgi:putative phosphoesterase